MRRYMKYYDEIKWIDDKSDLGLNNMIVNQ